MQSLQTYTCCRRKNSRAGNAERLGRGNDEFLRAVFFFVSLLYADVKRDEQTKSIPPGKQFRT
jgi:hypothetical protein